MDLDDLRTNYRGEENLPKEGLRKMLQTRNHPVLKRIRRQLIFESLLWTLFLIVFYDFFDGHLKPPVWNGLLALSVILILIHNLLGYRLAKSPVSGGNLKRSLENYLRRMRRYATISIVSRATAIVFVMLFFTSATGPGKFWISMAALVALVAMQVYALSAIWRSRIKRINNSLESLSKN